MLRLTFLDKAYRPGNQHISMECERVVSDDAWRLRDRSDSSVTRERHVGVGPDDDLPPIDSPVQARTRRGTRQERILRHRSLKAEVMSCRQCFLRNYRRGPNPAAALPRRPR